MLWIDFINSDARDHLGRGNHEERLQQATWVREFLRKHQLKSITIRSSADLAILQKFRARLRRWAESLISGQSLTKSDVAALNRHLIGHQIRTVLAQDDDSFRLDLVPTTGGVDYLLTTVAISFARFLVDGDPRRLKTCDNADCLWLFYDSTRSRTRRWCAVGCGDLIKVREFRQRHKHQSTSSKRAGTSKRKN